MLEPMIRRLPALVVLVVLVVLVSLAAPSVSAASSVWYYAYRPTIKCVRTPQGLIYAHVVSRMSVRNHDGFRYWVSNMRLSARLISPNAGLQISRSWHTTRFPVFSELLQDRYYWKYMAVNTDVMSPNADWNVQVKYIWDRKVPLPDIVWDRKYTFDMSRCRNGQVAAPYQSPTTQTAPSDTTSGDGNIFDPSAGTDPSPPPTSGGGPVVSGGGS